MDVDYLNETSKNYPRFVVCIPHDKLLDRYWKSTLKDYESFLNISYSHVDWPSRRDVESVSPKFKPMIFDEGYAAANGFDTFFGLCYPLKKDRYYRINWSGPIDANSSFLSLYSSLSEDPSEDLLEDKFLELSHELVLSSEFEKFGCIALSIENLVIKKFKSRGEKHQNRYPGRWFQTPKYKPKYYNLAYCLDLCITREIKDRLVL